MKFAVVSRGITKVIDHIQNVVQSSEFNGIFVVCSGITSGLEHIHNVVKSRGFSYICCSR